MGRALEGRLVGQESREGISTLLKKASLPRLRGATVPQTPEMWTLHMDPKPTWSPAGLATKGNRTGGSEGPQGKAGILASKPGPLRCRVFQGLPGHRRSHSKSASTRHPPTGLSPYTPPEHQLPPERPAQGRSRHRVPAAGRAHRPQGVGALPGQRGGCWEWEGAPGWAMGGWRLREG